LNSKLSFVRSRYTLALSLIVVAVGIPLLFIPWNNTYHPRSLKLIWNFGHVPLFACAAILLTSSWPAYRKRIFEAQIGILAVLAAAAGMAIEAIQFYTGRQFSFQDVWLDVIGACLVPVVIPVCRGMLIKYSLWIIRLAVLACLLARAYPLGISLLDEYQARRQFPVLAGFESSLELDRFGGGSRLNLRGDGLQVRFGMELYSGFSLKYFPSDWSGYHVLSINIRNPGTDAVYLTCRIHDQHHDQSYEDRFNRRFTITPGEHTVNIDLQEVAAAPRGRTMDMKNIGGLGCFTVRLAAPRVLIIRKIALD